MCSFKNNLQLIPVFFGQDCVLVGLLIRRYCQTGVGRLVRWFCVEDDVSGDCRSMLTGVWIRRPGCILVFGHDRLA
jgi:hypothetical protein